VGRRYGRHIGAKPEIDEMIAQAGIAELIA